MRTSWAAAVSGILSVCTTGCAAPQATARVDSGPVGERIVARAVVEPSHGVRHVFAVADGKVTRVLVHEGERVDAATPLLELEVAGRTEALKAPERGVVLARHCEVGDWVLAAEHGATTALFELADPAQIELRVEIEERDASKLTAAMEVAITALGPKPASLRGRVSRVAAQLERRRIGADDSRVRAEGLVRVLTVAFVDPKPDWPLGSRVEASIELSRHEAATRLPRAALSVRDGRTVALGKALLWTRELPVEIVRVDDAYAEIRGLAHGTEVILPR